MDKDNVYIIIRHGICKNGDLIADGWKQIEEQSKNIHQYLRKQFQNISIVIYSSATKRAHKSAEILGKELGAHVYDLSELGSENGGRINFRFVNDLLRMQQSSESINDLPKINYFEGEQNGFAKNPDAKVTIIVGQKDLCNYVGKKLLSIIDDNEENFFENGDVLIVNITKNIITHMKSCAN